ncbi:MAG: phospholipid carrier-dependent glycosyltransferase [Patescibacteria group bacterium]
MNKSNRIFFILVFLLAIFVVLSRFYRLSHPNEMYFDEVYHVPAALLISQGDERAFEWWHSEIYGTSNHDWLHPPLAKYFQAVSILIFGNNPFGWRFFSAFFGCGVILLTGLLVGKLTKRRWSGLLASFLVAVDGLSLVESRIAMNDIFLMFFSLISLMIYFSGFKFSRKRILATGIFLGLALATKWSALLVILAVLLIEVIRELRKRTIGESFPYLVFSLTLVPVFIYVLSYTPMLLQQKNFDHFFELHRQIINYQFNRDGLHAYQSQPWQWLFNLRPVWFWRGEVNAGSVQNIYLLGNPVLVVLTIGVVFWQLKRIITYRKWQVFSRFFPEKFNRQEKVFYCYLAVLFFFNWCPWFFSPRIIFYYHFLPANLFLLMLTSLVINQFLSKKVISLLIVGLICTFLLYWPHWTGGVVSASLANSIYWPFSFWR